MGEFVRVAVAEELAPGRGVEAWVNGKAVAVFNVGGSYHAISNTCLHRGGPLGQGSLDGCVVLCPWHAWGWDVTTGVSDANPEMRLATYEVNLQDGQVFVKADE